MKSLIHLGSLGLQDHKLLLITVPLLQCVVPRPLSKARINKTYCEIMNEKHAAGESKSLTCTLELQHKNRQQAIKISQLYQ